MAARLHLHIRLLTTMFVPAGHHPPTTSPPFSYPRSTLTLPLPSHSFASTSCYNRGPNSPLQATSALSLDRRPAFRTLKQRHPGVSPSVRSLACSATKAAKSKIKFCCSSCGHDEYKYFGKCPMCGEFGTYVHPYILVLLPSPAFPFLAVHVCYVL